MHGKRNQGGELEMTQSAFRNLLTNVVYSSFHADKGYGFSVVCRKDAGVEIRFVSSNCGAFFTSHSIFFFHIFLID